MERNEVVEYLASLTAAERESVIVDAVQRAHPWHRRMWNGIIVCVRLSGDGYLIAITDDPSKAESVYADNKIYGGGWFVDQKMQKID